MRALTLLTPLILGACAVSPTAYQPQSADSPFGYSDQALERDRVRVVFRGNHVTPREAVENALLFRAAETTLERGYRFFVPTQQDVEDESRDRPGFTAISTGFGFSPFGSRFVIVESFPQSDRESYRASAVFKLLENTPEGVALDVFNAEDVIEQLGPSITRPQDTTSGNG
ncbi:MAG: hypothetical protein ABF296_03700 [Oceanococcaceae bacterium]